MAWQLIKLKDADLDAVEGIRSFRNEMARRIYSGENYQRVKMVFDELRGYFCEFRIDRRNEYSMALCEEERISTGIFTSYRDGVLRRDHE